MHYTIPRQAVLDCQTAHLPRKLLFQPVLKSHSSLNGGVIAANTWVGGMTDLLQVILLLATLIWTIVKIAQVIKDFYGE